MRALLLTSDYPPRAWSGIGAAVEGQARALAAAGVGVTVVVSERTGAGHEAGAVGSPAAAGGPRVVALGRDRFPADPGRHDLVHVHSVGLAGLAVEIARRYDLPLVYTAHALLHRELPPTAAARFWVAAQARLMGLADRVVFPSRHERDEAVRLLPALEPRARVVPNCLAPPDPSGTPARDADRADDIRGAVPPDPRGPVVFLGRFAAAKGLDLLARFAPGLLAGRPGALVLAGGHGDAGGERAVAALRAALGPRCAVPGWLGPAGVRRLLRRAALVVVPSRREPFGLVALEAMAAGAPVLAADAGGLPEVVGPGSGGRLVRGREPRRWEEAAATILQRPDVAAELRRRGPVWVRERFGPPVVARALTGRAYDVA